MHLINLSLICVDPLNIENDLRLLSDLGLKKLHYDVMDSNYVTRFGVYPEMFKCIEEKFEFESDCHLMVEDVAHGIEEWSKYGIPNKFSYHYKDQKDNALYINDCIRDKGAKPIIVYDLSVHEDEIISSIKKLKPAGIMLMGITPGVLIQQHNPENVLKKLKNIRSQVGDMLEWVQIDGGVNFDTMSDLVLSGANELICGSSSIYKGVSFNDNMIKNESIVNNMERIERLLNDL